MAHTQGIHFPALSSPGALSGAIVAVVPVLTAAGLSPEGVAQLLGIDVPPDMFRTDTKATPVMASSRWIDRRDRAESKSISGGQAS